MGPSRDKDVLFASRLCGAPHAFHQGRVGKIRRGANLHHSPVTHHGNAVAGVQHLPKNVANQHDAAARADKAPDKLQELFGNPRIQRRRGFIEDHQVQVLIDTHECTGNFDHLAFADRQIGNDVVATNIMARKNLIKTGFDQRPGFTSPAPATNSR